MDGSYGFFSCEKCTVCVQCELIGPLHLVLLLCVDHYTPMIVSGQVRENAISEMLKQQLIIIE